MPLLTHPLLTPLPLTDCLTPCLRPHPSLSPSSLTCSLAPYSLLHPLLPPSSLFSLPCPSLTPSLVPRLLPCPLPTPSFFTHSLIPCLLPHPSLTPSSSGSRGGGQRGHGPPPPWLRTTFLAPLALNNKKFSWHFTIFIHKFFKPRFTRRQYFSFWTFSYQFIFEVWAFSPLHHIIYILLHYIQSQVLKIF